MHDLRTQLQQCFQGRVCLMGLGNTDCGDDGFGLRLAEAVRELALPETLDAPSTREGSSLSSSGGEGWGEESPCANGLARSKPCSAELGVSNRPARAPGQTAASSPPPSPPEEERGHNRSRDLDVGLIIAGTTPERFIGRVTEAGFDHLIFLDAVEFGGAPGAVIFLNSEEMTSRFPQVSTHKISLGLLAKWVEAGGKTKAWLLGVQPESLRPGADLSPSVRGTQELLKRLLQQVRGAVLNLC